MPSEPYNWDRKHDGPGGGGGGGAARWREHSFPQQHYHHYNNNNYPRGGYNNYRGGGGGGGAGGPHRWAPDLRYRPLGHGKQGSRHLYLDEFGHGLMPSRPTERMLEEESCRQSGSGRYNRVYRGSFVQKDWKANSSEIATQPDRSGRLNSTSERRSVDVMPSHNSSTPSSDSINSRDQSLPKFQHENSDVVGSLGSADQKLERGSSLNSIDCKPLKWARSDSLSVRNLGFSHSSSSKSMEPDCSEMKMELMQKNVVPVLSSPRAAVAAEKTNAAAEETNSLKKPRVRWGEGLAKYENKRVETSDETGKNGAITCGSSLEPLHSYAIDLTDRSPKLVMVSECASPATPSSVACSSSPGLEQKVLIKDGSTVHDNAYICNSPGVAQNNSDRSFNLEELDLTAISQLTSSIEELLQSDDPTVESSFVRSTAMNKILLLKNNISKAVETTEIEIDLLENELKSMLSELESSNNHLYASTSVPVACLSKPNEDHSAYSNADLRFARLHAVVDSDIESEDDLVMKDAYVDSPGSATSKFVEVPFSKDVSLPETLKETDVTGVPDLIMSNVETEPDIDHLVEETPIGLSSDGIDSNLVGCSSVSSEDDNLNFYKEDFSHELILASKSGCEQIASEVVHKLLPSSGYHFNFSRVVEASYVQNDLVKELFSRKTYYYKLKEKILSLKFKIFRHLWKEGMHIPSLKKLRSKNRKKFGLSLRKANTSYQMQRPSIRSRCSSAGLNVAVSEELLSYASRLLAEPQTKPLRSVLKMPSMNIDIQGKITPRFISYNGVVEDPLAVEKERSIFNPWSSEEEELFIDKLAVFGKDFRKIASFLPHKTTADCVEFYYKNHKSDAFKRAKKTGFSKHQTTAYLLTAGNRLNREANALPHDIVGTASANAAKIDNIGGAQQKHISKSILASGIFKMENGGDNLVDRPSSLCLFNDEREAVAADVLAGICGSLSSEAMSSCITSSLDHPAGGYQDQKYQRMGSSTRRPLTPEVTQNVAEMCSDESGEEVGPTDWTDEEKTLLIQALSSYGKDFNMISRCLRTKTHDQCKVFFSKARKCLGLDKICLGSDNLITDDVNRGRSDACLLETGSVICNGKSGPRIDDNVASVNLKFGHDPIKVSTASVKPDLNSAQEIVVRDMDCSYTLTSENFLPDDQEMEDKFELVFDGNQGNGSTAEVIPDLGVAGDLGPENAKNFSNVLETATQSRHMNAACLKVPEAEPGVEGCLPESSLTANCFENKETSTTCSVQDEHRGVHLASNEFLQRTPESGVEEKPFVLQQAGSALVHPGKCLQDDLSVVPEKLTDEVGVKHYKMIEQHLPGISLEEQMTSTCKADQYPTAISTIKEMSSDTSSERLIPEGTNVAQCLGREFHLRKCLNRQAVSSDAEVTPSPHQEEDHSGCPSGCQPHINKLSTNGDVKLFGKILSKTSHHKPNLSPCLGEGCSSSQYHSLGSESSSGVKCPSSQQAVEGLSAHLKHDHKNIVGSDNLTLRNIGFQDQSRIHSGSSTMPDSTILLARYPTAFSNYVPPSSKIELKLSNGIAKSGECCLNGVTTFLNKDVSVNHGSADLHVYRNQEVQAFSLDMRHRHDQLLAQMQRTGFDVVPGLQQQSGGMVAINVVGRGPVLGGQFVSVSDPVAAIRMHYAKSEQQQFSGLLAANIIREDDPWRGKGSVGR